MKNKTIDYQKKIAFDILHKFEAFDPTCILAGGAPRDWYFGNIAKDLDFYVYFRPDLQSYYIQKILDSTKIKFYPRGESEFPDSYKRNPYLKSVYEANYKGEKVQVMFMDKPTFECVVDLFPFGICQAWWKGEDIFVTKNFEVSVSHKILQLLNELYNDEDGYIEKIRNKFPDYLYIGKR